MKSALSFLCPVAVVLLISSCQPAVHLQVKEYKEPLEPFENVMVTKNAADVPAGAVKVGDVSVTDAGMTTKCSYGYVLDLARQKARQCGGDILLITDHKHPDLWSSCHRIWAHAYRSPDEDEVAQNPENDANRQQPAAPEQNPETSDGGDKGDGDQQKEQEEKPEATAPPTDSRGSNVNPGYFGERPPSREMRPGGGAVSGTETAEGGVGEGSVVLPAPKQPSVMISAFGGFGRRLAPIADLGNSVVEEFMNGMRSGGIYGLDMAFRVSPSNYIGFQFNRFRSSGELGGVFNGGSSPVVGTWEENVDIDFFGVHWTIVGQPAASGSYFYATAALGFTSYSNYGVAPFETAPDEAGFLPFEIDGGTLGYRLEGGGHIALGDNIFLKIGLGLNTGVITEFDLKIGNETSSIKVDSPRDGEGLVRLDVFGGLVIAF